MGPHFARIGLCAALALAVAGGSTNAGAGFGAPAIDIAADDDAPDSDDGPARRYAQLGRDDCEGELMARGVSFTRLRDARGVLAPIRLTGPLHGVRFHSGVPAAERDSSPWEIVDCRLALALDEVAAGLKWFTVR